MLKLSHRLILAAIYSEIPEYLEFFKAHPRDDEAINYIVSSFNKGISLGRIFKPVAGRGELLANIRKLTSAATDASNNLTPEILVNRLILPFFNQHDIDASNAVNVKKDLEEILTGTPSELIEYLYKTLNSLYYKENYSALKNRISNISLGKNNFDRCAASRVVLRYLEHI